MADRPRGEARIDAIEQTWASASDETLLTMLEQLRFVIEDVPENWHPEYLVKAHRLVWLIIERLPTPDLDE